MKEKETDELANLGAIIGPHSNVEMGIILFLPYRVSAKKYRFPAMPNNRFCIIADFDKICREVEGVFKKHFGYMDG